jgi:ABC-type microcin C transport system duplicated ATPase subunit YejF
MTPMIELLDQRHGRHNGRPGGRPLLTPGAAPAQAPRGRPVLEVDHLSVAYTTRGGTVQAVRDVSLVLPAGQTLGIVGESGCGKSTLAYAIMGYLGEQGRVTAGSIRLHGRELVGLPPAELRRLRGSRMAMVYQDPQTALNPSLVVGGGPSRPHGEVRARVLAARHRVARPRGPA